MINPKPYKRSIWKIEKAFYLSVGIWQKNEVHAYDTTCLLLYELRHLLWMNVSNPCVSNHDRGL